VDVHQRLVSVVKMETVLEQCAAKELRSVLLFCGQKDSAQMIFIKKCFLFTMESCLSLKAGRET
jgi:hypothetical protein